jgi:hypothetical protein
MKKFFAIGALFIANSFHAQTKVLFLGNSYTSYNNLPQLTADCANSAGYTLITGSNTPGGHTFQQHTTNATSQSLIAAGDWDYVVLQEQSQLPSFPDNQVATQCFPYATQLDDQIHASNPCAKTIFYMTWGRENGDAANCASWPPVCTYEGMDSLLNLRYRQMALDNQALLSPVGAVWKYLRINYPNIDLYNADGSHPTIEGSYVAACCMNVAMFQIDPTTITFNSTLNQSTADIIKSAVRDIVYYNLWEWQIVNNFGPTVELQIPGGFNNPLAINNVSSANTSFSWLTDEGDISTDFSPVFQFETDGEHLIFFDVFENGCFITTDSLTVMITSLSTPEILQNFKAVRTSTHITLMSESVIEEIYLFNVVGKQLAHSTAPNNVISLPITNSQPIVIQLKINNRWFYTIK